MFQFMLPAVGDPEKFNNRTKRLLDGECLCYDTISVGFETLELKNSDSPFGRNPSTDLYMARLLTQFRYRMDQHYRPKLPQKGVVPLALIVLRPKDPRGNQPRHFVNEDEFVNSRVWKIVPYRVQFVRLEELTPLQQYILVRSVDVRALVFFSFCIPFSPCILAFVL